MSKTHVTPVKATTVGNKPLECCDVIAPRFIPVSEDPDNCLQVKDDGLYSECGGPVGPEGPAGPQGATGPQGIMGPAGPLGLQGPQGPAGPQGAQGPTGEPGPQGAQGPAGAQGVQGPQGAAVTIVGELDNPSELPPVGNPGDAYLIAGNLWVWTGTAWENVGNIQGPEGPQGPIGPQGPQGLQGLPGAQGPEGPQGIQGPEGDAGPQGIQGPEGPQGIQGLPGAQGPEGPQGIQGLPGDTGPQGIQGPEGPQGPQGPAGDEGPQGPAGANGVIASLVAGTGIAINNTDPANPIVSATGETAVNWGDIGGTLSAQTDLVAALALELDATPVALTDLNSANDGTGKVRLFTASSSAANAPAAIGTTGIFIPNSTGLGGVMLVGRVTGSATEWYMRSQAASSWGPWSKMGNDRSAVTPVSSVAGVVTLNAALGDYFTLILTENVTSWVISNAPPGFSLMVQITQGAGPYTIADPGTVPGGSIAVSTGSGAVDLLAISSFNSGTTLRSNLANNYS